MSGSLLSMGIYRAFVIEHGLQGDGHIAQATLNLPELMSTGKKLYHPRRALRSRGWHLSLFCPACFRYFWLLGGCVSSRSVNARPSLGRSQLEFSGGLATREANGLSSLLQLA